MIQTLDHNQAPAKRTATSARRNPVGTQTTRTTAGKAATGKKPAKRTRALSPERKELVRQILEGKADYVHNQLFETDDAEQQVFDNAPQIPTPDTSWYHPVMDRGVTDLRNPSAGTLVLTAEQERALFLQFNYCRYRVAQLHASAQGQSRVPVAKARQILHWHDRSEAYRDQIAQTNLALVLAMAKRTRMSEVDFSDMISEGNMALLRAVDKFDAARGFKFSTYACRAILKAFSRSGMKLSKYRQLFPTDFDPKLEKSDYMEKKRESHEEDCVDEVRDMLRTNTAELTDIEKKVIEHRFAVGEKQKADPEAGPLTLEQVGRIIGVTKERVRQIQNKALEKLRQSLETGYLA